MSRRIRAEMPIWPAEKAEILNRWTLSDRLIVIFERNSDKAIYVGRCQRFAK